MSNRLKNHRPPVFLLLILLAGLTALTAHSPVTSARVPGGVPLRLRLRVQHNTLKPGASTKIFVEFLDRDYEPVANDSTRVIRFGRGAAKSQTTGEGNFSPAQVTIKPGELSRETTFTSTQSGRVLLTAQTDGLDPAQTLLVVTPKVAAASFLSGLFETVAYAEEAEPETDTLKPSLDSLDPEAIVGGKDRAKFQVTFKDAPKSAPQITISVAGQARIVCADKILRSTTKIKFPEGDAASDEIEITSDTTGNFKVIAKVEPNGPTAEAFAQFDWPEATRIMFTDDRREISSTETDVKLSLELTDEGGSPVPAARDETIDLKSAIGEDYMKFDPPAVSFKKGQRSAETTLRWTMLPLGNELTLLAEQRGGQRLRSRPKTIIIHSQIQKVKLVGLPDTIQGGTEASLTVQLADKDGRPQAADVDRPISLSATNGVFIPSQVTLRKKENQVAVKFRPTASAGKAVLLAQSVGLADESKEILLLMAPLWLNLSALFGGLGGALVRQLHQDPKFKKLLPERTAEGLQFGLLGRIACCVFCGLILYWTMKLGLSGLLGVALPASLDLGTNTAAGLLGVTGGFAGTVVLSRLVNVLVPGQKEEEATGSVI